MLFLFYRCHMVDQIYKISRISVKQTTLSRSSKNFLDQSYNNVPMATKTTSVQRFTDSELDLKKTLGPIEGWEKMPLVSLEDAVKPIASIVPNIELNVFIAKQNCKEPEDGLTCDESASIMLYTYESNPKEHSLYFIMNTNLRTQQRAKQLRPWFLYFRLIFTALAHLPSERRFIFRGIKEDLRALYPKGKKITWWGFSSCTQSVEVLESETFLGKHDARTIFQIDSHSSKSIKSHSYITSEDEVLLLPGRQFFVQSCMDAGNGLFMIQLRETESEFEILVPPTVSSAVSAASTALMRCGSTSTPPVSAVMQSSSSSTG